MSSIRSVIHALGPASILEPASSLVGPPPAPFQAPTPSALTRRQHLPRPLAPCLASPRLASPRLASQRKRRASQGSPCDLGSTE